MPKSKKATITPKRTIENNLYLLRLIHDAVPGFVLLRIAVAAIVTLADFLSGTYLLRFAINGVGKLGFGEIVAALLLFLAAILLSQFIGDFAKHKLFPPMQNKLTKSLNRIVYEKAARVDLECYENPDYFNKLSRAVGECSTNANNILTSLTTVISVAVSFSLNLFLVLFIDPVLLLFSLIPLLSIPLRAKANQLGYERDYELTAYRRQQDYSRRTFYLADYAKEMRITNFPSLMLRRFNEASKNIIEIVAKYGISLGVIGYVVSELNETITALGAMLYSVWQTVAVGAMRYGDCVIIINSINSIARSLSNASNIYLNFQRNALYIDNLRDFLDFKERLTDGDSALPESGDIVFSDVSFTYQGAAAPTLKHINLRFGANERVALVGHNGAGKSTIVKLLLRLYDCDGSISYGGVDIKSLKLDDYRGIFSSVMQDSHLFALSLEENVLRRPTAAGDETVVTDALKNVGLWEKAKDLENGLATPITKEFDNSGEWLSGGEAQKLAISTIYTK